VILKKKRGVRLKNRIITTVIIIFFIFVQGCGDRSAKQNMPPMLPPAETAKVVSPEVYNNLFFIKMFDDMSGWAISPTAVIRCDKGIWADVSPKDLSGISFGMANFANPNTGWVSTSKTGATNINILRTVDGGKTWLTTDIAPTEPGAVPTVKTINFVDATHGWLAVSYGVGAGSEMVEVYQTINGGETWTLVASPRLRIANSIPGGGLKTGLSFIDAQRGWLTGLWYGDTVWLYMSDDSGQTWKPQTIKVPAGYITQAGAVETRPPIFFGNNTGMLPLVARSQGQAVIFYMTEDKGQTWKATKAVKSTSNEPPIWSFVNSKTGFASDHIQIFKTIDSGSSWKTIKPNLDFKAVTQIDFVTDQIGWGIGKGVFIKTADGGISWSPAIK